MTIDFSLNEEDFEQPDHEKREASWNEYQRLLAEVRDPSKWVTREYHVRIAYIPGIDHWNYTDKFLKREQEENGILSYTRVEEKGTHENSDYTIVYHVSTHPREHRSILDWLLKLNERKGVTVIEETGR